MTELQMGLIGLGAIAVVGVLAYNKWQEARQRKQVESALHAAHPDVLIDGGSRKDAAAGEEDGGADGNAGGPKETAAPPVGEIPSAGTEGRREPVLTFPPDAPAPEPSGPSLPPVSTEPSAPPVEDRFLSPRVDFIAAIDTVEPVPEQRIVDAPRAALARLRKPVRWIGYDEASGEWRLISGRQGGEYRHIRAGLQLVDRQGLVNGDDLAVFAAAMQDLAEQLTGIAELPPWQNALDAAVELDQFCAGVDIQIGINVVSQGQAFAGTKLRALAESAGMAIEEDGRFARRDDDGNLLFALLNQEAAAFSAETMRAMSTHGLTFLLDVPNVAHGERAFNQMIELARRFAEVLRGELVDDNRRPLSDAALEPIRRQIVQYQAMLAAQHLPAGSPLTRRLFS
ncbi:MAG: cell division protein ZipA C-terminal FtsZ-binding domain-containing protein [Candidatus Accumulibacter sp.]|jgi:hypothetical protein|nr:cell division protein ZipA C-terminal FtsZ-binding domain-containing protein [Accumulibacter sp.]